MKNNLLSDSLVYNGVSQSPTRAVLIGYGENMLKETPCHNIAQVISAGTGEEKVWIRVQGFRDTEFIRGICEHYGIDFLTIQDIINVNHPSKIDCNDNFNFIVARIFNSGGFMGIRLVQGKNFLLSFTEGESDFLDGVQAAMKNNVLKMRSRSTAYLLSVMVNELVSNYISNAMSIGDNIEDLQTELFAASVASDFGERIQEQRKRYMLLKRIALPLKDQYVKLLAPDSPLITKAERPFFKDVNDHMLNAAQLIDNCRDNLSSLMDMYLSNNSMRMNDIMKRLTLVSTIFIPLTFLVGVWGMNFRHMPELEWRYGYLYAWIIMLVVALAVILFFKTKKWR